MFIFPSLQLNIAVSEGPEICLKAASRKVDERKHRAWITFTLPINNPGLGRASWPCDLFGHTEPLTYKDPMLESMFCCLCLENLSHF